MNKFLCLLFSLILTGNVDSGVVDKRTVPEFWDYFVCKCLVNILKIFQQAKPI